MSVYKRGYTMVLHRVVIMCVAVIVGSTNMMSQSPLATSTEITMNDLTMMSNVAIVQLAPGADVFNPAGALPNGVEYAGRLLDPSRTALYNGSLFLRTNVSLQDLYEAEDALTRVVYVRFDGPVDPVRMAARLQKDPAIVFAEPWYVAQVQADPNDPLFGDQDALALMGLSEAWDVVSGNPNIVVAISDNGVDQSHEDLGPNIWINEGEIPNNNIDDDNNGYIDDAAGFNFAYLDDNTAPGNTTNNRNDGHGTKVAGIAGARVNNGIGMAGAAGTSRIFPLKTASRDGGGIIYGYQSLMYSADMGFSIANTSWGIIKPPSPIDQAVIDYCLAKGTVVIASAGNHGTGLSGNGWNLLNFPSAYDGVMGVGETSTDDRLTSTTGLGRNSMVAAPGNRAIATYASGGYGSSGVTGTSFAAPLTAGVAALWCARGSLSFRHDR